MSLAERRRGSTAASTISRTRHGPIRSEDGVFATTGGTPNHYRVGFSRGRTGAGAAVEPRMVRCVDPIHALEPGTGTRGTQF